MNCEITVYITDLCIYILLCCDRFGSHIVHYYDFLSTHTNNEGFTPLKVLATRPSAFRSASKFSLWKLILYHCKL